MRFGGARPFVAVSPVCAAVAFVVWRLALFARLHAARYVCDVVCVVVFHSSARARSAMLG
eukprot:11206717-Lingulodinium_polyedra.AAC.1